MALSPYTIDVAPCQPDGSREIFLQHHQRPCFSTTHREVLRVCLAKWPTKPSVEEAAHATDLDSAEAIRTHHTEEAYRTLLDGTEDAGAGYWANATDAAQPSQGTEGQAGDSSQQKEETPILEDYLCVFHREELADQHGRYTFVQPQTICTAYRVRDTAFLEVVLHGLSPRDIAAASSTGSAGVFLHGRRQPSRAGGANSGWGNALEHQGLLYKPAADAWWMGSPLSVKPVYVAVGPVASPPATAEGGSVPSAPVLPAEQPRAEETGAACVVVADAPLTVGNEGRAECPCSSPPQASPLNNIDAAAPVEGRTAQGQYDFPRSRSSSPIMHSPLPPSSSPAAAAVAASNNTTDMIARMCGEETKSTLPPPAAHTQTTSKSKFVSLDATLLTQLPLYDAESAAVLPQSLAVVRTGPDTLGLAVTTPLYALDAMLWQGWPHRVRFSRLASSTSALSVVASPHPSTPRYLLFLYDAHYSRLRVLRTPDLHTGAGDLELLFSFACGDLPFVLPCLHADHPSPIAVCNYPHANCISVYDVVALQEQPSADAAVVCMDVGAHQAAHPQCFGEVRLTGEAAACHADAGLPLEPQSIKKPRRAADALEGDKDSVHNKWRRQACEAKTWAADAASSSLSHPIRGLLYHYASCLVLQYDWPGGAAARDDDDDAEAARVVLESGRVGDGGHNSNSNRIRLGGGRRRRRCEGTVSYSVHFPSLLPDTQPLVVFMLEALGAALGPRAVAHVEYELFTEAWRCSCTADAAADPLEICAALIRRLSMPPALLPAQPAQPVHTDEEVEESSVPHFAVADACMFVDPSMLTIQGIRQALHASEAATTVDKSISSYAKRGKSRASVLSWTSQQAGLALVALHLLYEGCRLQEPLWELLPPLAALNSSLSVHLQWPSYMEYYSAVDPAEMSSRAEFEATQLSSSAQCFRECLSPEMLADHFDFLQPHPPVQDSTHALPLQPCGSGMVRFADGEAPELFRTLSLLAMGSGGGATHTSAICDSWPLLRRVPDAHPIALANRLVVVYHAVFCSPAECATRADNCGNADGDVGMDVRWWERVCAQLLQHNISARLVRQVLNTGVAYPLLEALTKGREQAAPDWPATMLDLVGRRDQCPPTSRAAQLISAGRHVVEAAEANAVARQICATMSEDDGVSVRPDFRQTWRDARLDVAQNLFNTVAPISLAGYEDRPEELAGALELLSCRARAMPLGRGMLTMCTQSFKVQDSIPIPPLNLNGRTNDGIAITNKATDDLMWPLFHNGCAAGLRFLPLPPTFGVVGNAAAADGTFSAATVGNIEGDGLHTTPQSADSGSAAAAAAQSITKQWVMYQTKNIGNAASRAGLLLATGILGHLTVLQRTDIFYLLISRQEQYVWREATTMAVMLGLSCSFCGTSSEAVFRCLSVHVQSLNPSAEDIEVSLDVQTAALVSMGLLCQQAPSNTFLVEVFLVEISRLPTDEHCSKREGCVLGAGFGLGQLLLGVGAAHGVAHVEDRLLAFMNGAPRRSAVSTREGVASFEETMGRGEAGHFLARALLSQEQREATFNSCASVYEGDCYNMFVSGPAAVVALGMIYLQTDSAFIAAKVAPPNRRTAMQRLTPLLCHLRSTMSSLICWSNIVPTRAWLYGQLPSSLLELTASTATAAGGGAAFRLAAQQRNYLLMNLARCIAGQVMALGLRYAGTMETPVRDVILAEMQGFLVGRIGSTATVIPAVQRVTGAYETCVLTCANALSLVMAGTGDLKVFGVLQHLHRRTNVSYGSHMAISMSMGLLFLGSGRLSLSNSISSVAALLMAFYPLWPSDAEDNTHHLQALRQLYGLAVVPRVMEAVDAVSRQPVSVPVRIVLRRACPEGGDIVGCSGDGGAADEEFRGVKTAATTLHGEQQRNAATSVVAQEGQLREIRTRTPCLYPPAEMIDRVEILSPRHYPLTFTPASSELLRSATLEFRVMAKDGYLGHGDSLTTRSPLELRLLDWLHRLFHQPSTTAAEALAMQDGVRLMLGVQRRLVATALAGEVLLSGDFGASVKAAMEERYGYIFLHGGGDQRTAASTRVQRHPLYMLIMEGASCDVVVRSIAAHPKGTAAFPCDFTALIAPVSAHLRRSPSGGANEEAAAMTKEEEEEQGKGILDAVDLVALRRWIIESLHYYGLKLSVQQSIREAFLSLGGGGDAVKPVPAARLLCLLRLQCATQLPLSTLENVWACCVD